MEVNKVSTTLQRIKDWQKQEPECLEIYNDDVIFFGSTFEQVETNIEADQLFPELLQAAIQQRCKVKRWGIKLEQTITGRCAAIIFVIDDEMAERGDGNSLREFRCLIGQSTIGEAALVAYLKALSEYPA